MTPQFLAANFFPLEGFFPLEFTADSFIRGGECHRPWHIGGKPCRISLNVAIRQVANR